MSTHPKAILLMGPTASGKTGVAMDLTRRFPVELISVDSAQVFRDMDIGTAKPDAETLKEFPHHLINLISLIGGSGIAQAILIGFVERFQQLLGFIGGDFALCQQVQYDLPLFAHSSALP